MKIFNDYRAKRRYTDLYEMCDDREKKEFAAGIRKMADDKVMSLDDNLETFYLTEKDVSQIYQETIKK